MKTFNNPSAGRLAEILQRPSHQFNEIQSTVESIVSSVKSEGDAALKRLTSQLDCWDADVLAVSPEEIATATHEVPDELKSAILLAKENIEKFHASQNEEVKRIETSTGITCWRESVPIENVGLYIPGGTAPLISTLLMLGVPARLAGCENIIVCTPAMNGNVHPALLYSASVLGIATIFKIGGAQAIAAMAYGTKTVPQVYKIFGPGNRYVTLAKQLVASEVAIDMPAGPSELAVFADETCNPAFVAADLLSQAEHGADSQVVLVTTSQKVIDAVMKEVESQKQSLPRLETVNASLENSKCIKMEDDAACFRVLNQYAPEHLIIASDRAEELSSKVINAGSVFLGHYSPESAGDYISGTNHTLPTSGFTRSFSGVSLDSFIKKITFQQLTPQGLKNVSNAIAALADAEGLTAHKNAVLKRFENES